MCGTSPGPGPGTSSGPGPGTSSGPGSRDWDRKIKLYRDRSRDRDQNLKLYDIINSVPFSIKFFAHHKSVYYLNSNILQYKKNT